MVKCNKMAHTKTNTQNSMKHAKQYRANVILTQHILAEKKKINGWNFKCTDLT